MRPTQVLDMQGDLLSRLEDAAFTRYLRLCFTADHEATYGALARQQAMHKQVLENAAALTRVHQTHVKMADAYCIASSMTDMLDHVVTTLDESDEFHGGLAPSQVGIARFDRPILCHDIRGKVLKAHWLVWGPAQVMRADGELSSVTLLTWYNDGDDPDEADTLRLRNPADAADLRRVIGRWQWIGCEYIQDGKPLGAALVPVPEENQEEIRAEGDTPAETATNMPKYAYALWMLLGQTITVAEVEEPDRAGRKRAQRRKLPARVTVIKLRRRTQRSPGEPGYVEWQHKWMVKLHPRWQPYGVQRGRGEHVHEYGPIVAPAPGTLARFCLDAECDGRLIRIWISPYWKGPEDAPTKQSVKVYSLER